LARVQRSVTKMIRRLEHLPYKYRLSAAHTGADGNRMRGKGFKLDEGRFRIDISLTFFTERLVRHLKRMPREDVAAPYLQAIKARQDRALSNLV